MRTTIHRADGSVVAGASASEALRGLDFARTLEPVTAVACDCGKPAFWLGLCRECDAGGIVSRAQRLSELVAYHRAEAAKFSCKEADQSERYGSKYIVGVADWHGQLLPAVLNTETGLTSAAMSRTLAQRRCLSLNFFELRGEFMAVDCEDAKLLRKLHGVAA